MNLAKSKMSVKREKFCLLYAGGELGNGVKAYGKAFGIDISTTKGHRTARANASRLLTNANITARINELLEEIGITDELAKKHLTFLMNQFSDLNVKLAAVREYNRMRERVNKNLPESKSLRYEQFLQLRLSDDRPAIGYKGFSFRSQNPSTCDNIQNDVK